MIVIIITIIFLSSKPPTPLPSCTIPVRQRLWGGSRPRAVKILIAAAYSGVELDIPPMEMGVTNKTPEYMAMNPMGKVHTYMHTISLAYMHMYTCTRYTYHDTMYIHIRLAYICACPHHTPSITHIHSQMTQNVFWDAPTIHWTP